MLKQLRYLKTIRKETDDSLSSIAFDIYKLRKVGSGLREYYNYRLFDKSYPKEYKQNFLSWTKSQEYLKFLNPDQFGLIALNKFFTHIFLEEVKIPTSKLLFLYDPQSWASTEKILNSNDLVKEYLFNNDIKEFVCKPVSGSRGVGVDVFINKELNSNKLFLVHINGMKIGLDDYLKVNKQILFEERIKQSEYINQINSTSLNTIRCVTMLFPSGNVEILTSFWRIAREGKWVDNISQGSNIGSEIDINTGRAIEPVIIFLDSDSKIEKTDIHPDSEIILKKFQIKNWDKIINEIKLFQKKISFFKSIGWDIAITDNGPVVVEMNHRWDVRGQLISGKGWHKEIKNCYDSWRTFQNNSNTSKIFN